MYLFQFGFFAFLIWSVREGWPLAALALMYSNTVLEYITLGTLELLSPPNVTVPVVPIFTCYVSKTLSLRP
jgi:hypothetical protein